MTHDEITKAITDRIATIDAEIAKLQTERAKLAAMGPPAHAPERFIPVSPVWPPYMPPPIYPFQPLSPWEVTSSGDLVSWS